MMAHFLRGWVAGFWRVVRDGWVFWVLFVVGFVALDNPYVSKLVLGSDLTIPPDGYSFMYVYTGWLVLFLLSGICMYRGRVVAAYLLLAPSVIVTFLGFIHPEVRVMFENSYLGWLVIGAVVWAVIASVFRNTTLSVPALNIYIRHYRRLFSVDELRSGPAQYLLIASVAFLVFALKTPASSIIAPLKEGYICPVWFQNCFQWYIFSDTGYHAWSIVLMVLLSGALIAALSRRFVVAHALLLVPVLWQVGLMGLLTHSDFYYGHVMLYVAIFNLVVLFFPNKIMTLGWFMMMTYILALAPKMSDSWLEGNVFKVLDLGLPIFGDQMHTLLALTVIVMHGVVVWLLLCKKPIRYIAVGALIVFHIYSVAMIQYFFPAVAVAVLLIVFVGYERWAHFPTKRLHQFILIGLTGVLIVGQSVSLIIPGDSRLSKEGVRFGIHVFQRMSECIITTSVQDQRRVATEDHWQEERMGYCDPYYQFYLLKQQCLRGDVKQALLTMDIAINMEPFYRIIDRVDICSVEYHPLKHNHWIVTDRNSLEIIHYDGVVRQQGIL